MKLQHWSKIPWINKCLSDFAVTAATGSDLALPWESGLPLSEVQRSLEPFELFWWYQGHGGIPGWLGTPKYIPKMVSWIRLGSNQNPKKLFWNVNNLGQMGSPRSGCILAFTSSFVAKSELKQALAVDI